MKRPTKHRIIAAVAALLAVGAGALLANTELRTYLLFQVAPATARNSVFEKLVGPDGTTVYLLGTIHGDHLTTEEYGLRHLEAAIVHLRPEVLLVESRPEELAAGNVGDGPIEMPYANLVARDHEIPVEGIDWWVEGKKSTRPTDDERDDHLAGNLRERLGRGQVNLVLVGFSHVPELARRLAKEGYREAELGRAEQDRLLDPREVPRQFPAGLRTAVERRIAAEQAKLKAAPDDATADRIRKLIASRQAYSALVERVGERSAAPGTEPPP